MNGHTRENLTELLRRFMDDSAARAVQADIDAAERIMESYPAPAPSAETLSTIKALTVAAARKHRRTRIFRGVVATAAAVILTVLIGRHGSAPATRPHVSLASILPSAIWESHDIAADDLDLVYFNSEIRQIEAQMQAINSDETEMRRGSDLDDLEMELTAIETEFWKGSY
jgi:hypothetical protein